MDSVATRLLLGDNPWIDDPAQWETSIRARLPAEYIPRQLEERLRSEGLVKNKACLVIGPRQAGKSTLAWHTILALRLDALVVNCEEPALRSLCGSPGIFMQEMQPLIDRASVLFLEEVQHLEDAGLFIKGIVDRKPGVPVLVTGSAGYDLMARTRESLAGRAIRLTLLPLSLGEATDRLSNLPPPVRELKLDESWQELAVFGGFPEVRTSAEKELILSRLVDAFLYRDASDLYGIERPDAFRSLVELLARQIGNLMNVAEYASICEVSRGTVSSYLGILEDSHALRMVPPFFGGKRAELTHRHKFYFVDCGLRNAVLGTFTEWSGRTDQGPLLENWVCSELLKAISPRDTLRYWRSKSGAEVDFVVQQGETLLGLEVKAQAMSRPRLPRSSRSFIQAYEPAQFLVVNTGLEHEEVLGRTQVLWIRPFQIAELV